MTVNTADGVTLRVFSGRDAQHVRQLALAWWYQHRAAHGLVAKDFLSRCRMSKDGRTIAYYAR